MNEKFDLSGFIAGTLLIAPGTAVPPDWALVADESTCGWSRVTNAATAFLRDKSLAETGWTLAFRAIEIKATSFGLGRPRMFHVALSRLQNAATLQKCNCVELDGIEMHSFLGFPYFLLSAHARDLRTVSAASAV